MNGAMRVGGLALWHRIVRHWPRKVAAVLLAFIMWLFVSTTETTIAQRTLLVPVERLGGSAEAYYTGIPNVVEVTVSGPANRIDRLRPEGIEAAIDLTGGGAEFQTPVAVTVPQGVSLERVNPGEVFVRVERIASKSIPLQVVYLGAPPADVRLHALAEPDIVVARGLAAQLDRVTQAIVAVDPGAALATGSPFPADAGGRPVDDVELQPTTVQVTTVAETVLVRRRVPLELLPVRADRLREVTLDIETVVLAGPPTLLAALEFVTARLDLPTEGYAEGRYTLPVTIETPEGVVPVERVTATVSFAAAPRSE
jgi:YbbR domain-containing protein